MESGPHTTRSIRFYPCRLSIYLSYLSTLSNKQDTSKRYDIIYARDTVEVCVVFQSFLNTHNCFTFVSVCT